MDRSFSAVITASTHDLPVASAIVALNVRSDEGASMWSTSVAGLGKHRNRRALVSSIPTLEQTVCEPVTTTGDQFRVVLVNKGGSTAVIIGPKVTCGMVISCKARI